MEEIEISKLTLEDIKNNHYLVDTNDTKHYIQILQTQSRHTEEVTNICFIYIKGYVRSFDIIPTDDIQLALNLAFNKEKIKVFKIRDESLMDYIFGEDILYFNDGKTIENLPTFIREKQAVIIENTPLTYKYVIVKVSQSQHLVINILNSQPIYIIDSSIDSDKYRQFVKKNFPDGLFSYFS